VDLHRDPGWPGAHDPHDPGRHRVDVARYHHRRGGGQEPARLPGDRSAAAHRHTIKTLTGYIIVITAAFTIFSTFGLSWSQIQWLVAALGVGIGFGLQEIVANFISGLIILFERPVRVGDIVTIGNTTGVVSQIRIRATIVRSWD